MIAPPRGETSDDKGIVYWAAPDEKVEIRGSKVVKNWIKESDGSWKVEAPNSLFGDLNPFTLNSAVAPGKEFAIIEID